MFGACDQLYSKTKYKKHTKISAGGDNARHLSLFVHWKHI